MGKRKLILTLIGVVMVLGLFGCSKKYNVDYCGQKDMYTGAKNSYRAGQKVKIYDNEIATDTDYSFYLDGEALNYSYDEKKGFVITFTMPDHDVVLKCISENSMEYQPDYFVKVTLKSNPTTGYQWETSIDNDIVVIESDYVADSEEEDLCGGGGVQIFKLIPTEPGTVSVTFTYCRSWEPAEDDVTFTCTFEIDEDLQITMTEDGQSEEIKGFYSPEIVIY